MRTQFLLFIACIYAVCTGCNQLSNLAPPVFSVNVSDLPLYDTTITLQNVLPTDTTFLRSDAQNGNLTFVQERVIPSGRIGDSLRISTIPIQASFQLGNRPEITTLIESLANVFVPISTIIPMLPRSTTMPIPFSGTPSSGILLRSELNLSNDIEQITLRSGRVRLIVRNHLPFSIELRTLPNESMPVISFIPRSGANAILLTVPPTMRTIPSGDSVILIQSLENIRLAQGASIETQVFAASSRGIVYGDTAGVRVRVLMDEPVIAEARISLPSRQFAFRYAVPLAGGVKLSAARIQALRADLNVENGFDISGIATITAPQLRTQAGMPFQESIRIGRGMNRLTLQSTSPLDLVPDSLDRTRNNVIDSLRLLVDIRNDSVPFPERITVRQADNIALSGALSDTQLEFARGTSLPSTTFNLSADVAFSLSPELEKLGFTEVLAEKLDVELRLTNSAGADGTVSGTAYIFGRSQRPMDSLVLQNQEVKRAVEQSGRLIPVTTKFQASRTNIRLTEIPQRVRVIAQGNLLQNRPFFVERTSAVSGTALLSIPLSVRVTGGRFRDTIPFDVRSQIETARRNLERATLFLQSLNGISAEVQLRLHFLDEAGKRVLTLPDAQSSNTALVLRAAQEPSQVGLPNSPAPDEQRLTLTSEHLSILANARRMALDVQFSTPQNRQTVRFRTSDFVRLRASLNLQVKTP